MNKKLSRSRTQQHAFTICVDDEPVIHLSSFSETDSQSWISCIRSILWPPTSFAQLEKALGSHFDVAIIDNEFSFRAGLIGMYGNLQITSEKAVLTHPQTNTVVQEWQLSTVGFKLLPQAHPDDHNKVLTMITDTNSATGYGTIVMFCTDAEGLIRRVHSVRQMFVHKSYGDQMQEDMTQSGSLAESYSIYKIPRAGSPRLSPTTEEAPNFEFRKSLADPWLEKIVHDAIGDEKKSPSAPGGGTSKKLLWNNMASIPESMLDSSINFRNGCRTIPEELPECGKMSLRNSKSIEEADDDDEDSYRSLHEKIASGDCSPPPPLPQKTSRSPDRKDIV